ncbi:MAG TPA: hypothetical protein VGV09_18565 [Steroidobacteraceae bacterium]|nr:hypothetical protein [Steroidobacteraceae bacterium]
MKRERAARTSRLAGPATLLLALAAVGLADARTVMNDDLSSIPSQPRHIAVAASSWSGSPQSLVAAAEDLLEGSGLLKATGANILWFSDPAAPAKYHVVGAYGFTSSASVQQLVALLRGVEARLNDGQPARQGGPLLLELQWVEGVHISTPTLTLPSPNILGTSWGINAFVASSEEPFGAACAARRENQAFCTAAGNASRHSDMTQVYEVPQDDWIGGSVTPEILKTWAHAHSGDEEILAVAVDAMLTADEALRIKEQAPHADTYGLIDDAIRAVRGRGADIAVAFTANVAVGPLQTRIKSWLEAVRQEAATAKIVLRRAAVLKIGSAEVRGIIIGHRLPDRPPHPATRIDTVKVEEGGGAPGEPRVWSVVLQVPLPPDTRK